MRKKLLSKTYLRDVSEYIIKFDYTKEDYYLCVKRIIKTIPFTLDTGLTIIDNGYYLVEILPKNENYAMRVYLDENKNALEYYFDISLGNGIDEDSKIPYYDDLFTDVIVTKNEIEIVDQNELEDALNSGVISKEDYDLANITTEKLVNEIKENKNVYMNLNIRNLIDEIL